MVIALLAGLAASTTVDNILTALIADKHALRSITSCTAGQTTSSGTCGAMRPAMHLLTVIAGCVVTVLVSPGTLQLSQQPDAAPSTPVATICIPYIHTPAYTARLACRW